MNDMQAGIEADVMQFSLDDQDASLREKPQRLFLVLAALVWEECAMHYPI